jgi:hypothetical protein
VRRQPATVPIAMTATTATAERAAPSKSVAANAGVVEGPVVASPQSRAAFLGFQVRRSRVSFITADDDDDDAAELPHAFFQRTFSTPIVPILHLDMCSRCNLSFATVLSNQHAANSTVETSLDQLSTKNTLRRNFFLLLLESQPLRPQHNRCTIRDSRQLLKRKLNTFSCSGVDICTTENG